MSFIFVSVEKSTERHVGLWFVRSPEPIVAPPGDEVVFECSLNVGSESVRWKHNAEYLPPDSSGPTSHNTARPLPATNRLVKVLDERQAGDYQVRATPDHLIFTCFTQNLFCCLSILQLSPHQLLWNSVCSNYLQRSISASVSVSNSILFQDSGHLFEMVVVVVNCWDTQAKQFSHVC